MRNFRYIIIGGGSSGCVLANRLSKNPENHVLLLEAGRSDNSLIIRVPAGQSLSVGKKSWDWCYKAEPDPSRNKRIDLWPAGKVLGGGSSINGMVYFRGQHEDYDQWAELGNPGWDFKSVLPYFIKCETNELGKSIYHGHNGPLYVSNVRSPHLLAKTFVEAAVSIGIPKNNDFNGEHQEGAGLLQATQKNGSRHNTSQAYLAPIKNRKNLQIITKAFVTKIIVKEKKAIGVEYIKGNQLHKEFCTHEVIISAGAIASPKILMLSGIGPEKKLKNLEIPVIKNLPGVGENLQEHPAAWLSYFATTNTLNMEASPIKFIQHGLSWLFFGKGPATSPIAHAAAFVKSSPELKTPNLQIHFTPLAYDLKPDKLVLLDRPAVVASPNVCRPIGRGLIELKDNKPESYPIIKHQLLSHRDDLEVLIEGCKITRKIFQAKSFKPYLTAERMPGVDVQTDDEWEEYLRNFAALSYHFCGTCKMGNDSMSVVDHNLRVHGLQNLRVIDASIMPTIPSANTNGPTIMIAEKGADLVLTQSGGAVGERSRNK